jgi:hypothetical protein
MNRTEKRAYLILKQQGYLVEKPVRVKWHGIDFFGCWDFIVCNNQEIKFIQVSAVKWTNRPIEYREQLENFPTPLPSKKEYWWWNKKRGEFEIMEIK